MPRFLDAELLRRVRVELGLTQEQAASRLGITERAYRRYESGAVNHPERGFVVRHANRQRVTDRICREFGIVEEALLAERAAKALAVAEWRPSRRHPLPRARHFVGREALRRELGEWRDAPAPAARVVALVAIGGAGKTALLERLVATGPDEPAPRGVFTWSFYEDPRVDAFIREAAAYFGAAGAIEPLADALGAGPAHLLALDGLEVVQADGHGARARGELEDPLLRRLLRSIAAGLGAARAIVTSRAPLVDLAAWEGSGARSIRLDDLSRAEAALLLARWGVRGSDAERRRLAARLGGHALSVAVAGSYASAFLDGAPSSLERLDVRDAAEDDPLARRLAAILESYARALSAAERDLLARLSAFASGASLATVAALAAAGGAVAGALAGLDASKLRRLVARLERLGLVTLAGDSVLVHPFVRDRFVAQLAVRPEALHGVESGRLGETLRDRPDPTTLAVERDPAHLDRAEAIFFATLRAGLPNEAFLVYVRTLGGFPQLGLRSGEMARGARLMAALAAGGEPANVDARLIPDFRAAAAYDRGLYAGALGDLELAERCYIAHEAIAVETQGDSAVAERVLSARARAYTARLAGSLRRALRHIERSVALASEHGLESHLVRSVALEASIRHDLGDAEGAAKGFARARELEGEPEARRALWEAEHHLDLGRREAARALAERVVDRCERLHWSGHVAHARTLLGVVALAAREPDLAAARAHLEAARPWADASEEVEMILRVRELATRLALAERDLARAASEARRGLDVARSCGFRFAEKRLAALYRLTGSSRRCLSARKRRR